MQETEDRVSVSLIDKIEINMNKFLASRRVGQHSRELDFLGREFIIINLKQSTNSLGKDSREASGISENERRRRRRRRAQEDACPSRLLTQPAASSQPSQAAAQIPAL
eukprot:750366-Hanusia_phi.AAC.1